MNTDEMQQAIKRLEKRYWTFHRQHAVSACFDSRTLSRYFAVHAGHGRRRAGRNGLAAAGAPVQAVMAQGRWKTARMVEVYTRAEEARRAAAQIRPAKRTTHPTISTETS